MPRLVLFAFLVLLTADAAAAEPIDATWSEVAEARDGDCRLTVTSEGRFFRIAARGFGSGERARLVLANGDMKPIDWIIRTDGRGEFARYYLPFRWNRDGDRVAVSLSSGDCELATIFEWERTPAIVR